MKATQHEIQQFLDTKKMAIAGVSRNAKKFGYMVFNELQDRGYEVFPINPSAGKINDRPVFSKVSDLPVEVKHLIVITPKKETAGVVTDAIAHGIDNIWIQQMSETPEAIQLALEAKIRLVTKQCIFMWAEPVTGFHKFHRNIKRIFGLLPK